MKILATFSAKDEKWWNSLTSKEQEDYLDKHPNSKFAQRYMNSVSTEQQNKTKPAVNERKTTKTLNRPPKPINEVD